MTGKLALQHDMAKSVMVYGPCTTAYRVPIKYLDRLRPVTGQTEGGAATVKGVRDRLEAPFWHNRLQVNATVSHTDFVDFQAYRTLQWLYVAAGRN